jgi:hypothetical protein
MICRIEPKELKYMLKFIGALLPAVCMATASHAVDASIKKQLEKLDPAERLEQSCDTEAMKRIAAQKEYHPDKVIAYTFGDPKMTDDTIKAPGAVFRSKGEWYHLTYDCRTDAEQIDVKALSFQIGEKVPHDDWQKHYLYD